MKENNEIIFLGNWQYKGQGGRGYAGATWSNRGICATLNTMQGGNREPMILDIKKDNLICKNLK